MQVESFGPASAIVDESKVPGDTEMEDEDKEGEEGWEDMEEEEEEQEDAGKDKEVSVHTRHVV